VSGLSLISSLTYIIEQQAFEFGVFKKIAASGLKLGDSLLSTEGY
jgi:hypothetical protein